MTILYLSAAGAVGRTCGGVQDVAGNSGHIMSCCPGFLILWSKTWKNKGTTSYKMGI